MARKTSTGTGPNYPGGFDAQIIRVFLYADKRMNFRLLRFTGDGGEQPASAIDRHNEARAENWCDLDVTGLPWRDLLAAADGAADVMRGCTWAEWIARGNPAPIDGHDTWRRAKGYTTELTPEGEQTVIPGCERNAAPGPRQLDLFG